MKRLIVLIGLILMMGGIVMAEDKQSSMAIDGESVLFLETSYLVSPEMVIKPDGQIEINGVPIEKMSDPEIKESMKKIAEAMQQNSIIEQYDRQTGYLLEALDKCQREKQEIIDLVNIPPPPSPFIPK